MKIKANTASSINNAIAHANYVRDSTRKHKQFGPERFTIKIKDNKGGEHEIKYF